MRWLLPLVVLCSFARPARADLASSVYGDVQGVIEELIQTEVTTSVVRTVGNRSPALAFYMHGTLERLASPYWGSLGRVLKDDVTVAVADFVYWHMATGGGTGDMVASARRFFGCVKGTDTTDACQRLIAAVVTQKRPLLEVECRRTKPTADRRVACHVGLAVLAALKGRGEVRQHLVDALSDIVLHELGDRNVAGRMRDVLTKWMELPRDLPTPLLEALANPDLGPLITDEALDKRCGDWTEMRKTLEDHHGAFSWLCFAVTHKKMEPLLAAIVTIKEGEHQFVHTIPHWEIEAAIRDLDSDRADDDVAYRIFGELAWDLQCPTGKDAAVGPCAGKRFQPGAQITVAWLRRPPFKVTLGANGKLSGAPAKFLISPLIKFRRLARRIQELRSLVPPALAQTLFYAGQTVSADTKPALRAVHRMARLVTELRARWYLWAQNTRAKSFEELDIAELLHVARASLDQATISANSALAFLDKEASGAAATLDIGDWLRMVMRADYRSLAMESLSAALDLKLRDASRPHETFFLSLCAFLLDNSEGVGEAVARSAFRASAKELLLSASHRGVPRTDDRFRGRFVPRLSMRLSFSDVYAVTDGDSRRYVIAADWPTVMVAISDFVGIEVSFLDPIAPLAEMALRPAGKYSNYPYVALDALRPRLGVWVAVPQFSRRLALSSGFGARFLDVERLDDGSDPKMFEARYAYKPSLTFDAGLQFVF